MAKGRAKKITYPCPVCDKSCGGGTIHCTGCDIWVHPGCVPLTDAEFEEYGRSETTFYVHAACPRQKTMSGPLTSANVSGGMY